MANGPRKLPSIGAPPPAIGSAPDGVIRRKTDDFKGSSPKLPPKFKQGPGKGDPQWAEYLQKIEAYAKGLPLPAAEAHPETAQMMIINPLSGGGLRGLFSTHPATEERIARLHEIALSGAR